MASVIDDRGQAAVEWATARANRLVPLQYDVAKGELVSGSSIETNRQLRARISGSSAVLLEATTMGVAEIALVLKAAYQENLQSVDLLYLEPIEYRRESEKSVIQWGREFSLSGARTFQAVRGFGLDMNLHPQGTMVAFLGYEGARLRQALEQVSVENWNRYAVFGVPGFEPGWEINALANNIGVVAESHSMEGSGNHASPEMSIRYCAAASVSAAHRLLNSLRSSDHSDRPILVLPLGTKPHSIAAGIFVCDNSKFQLAGLSYDHPERSNKRTHEIREWHLYRVFIG